MKNKVGYYNGFYYKLQRICDVFGGNKSRDKWYFLYENGEPTGDHFRTMTEMRSHIDNLKERE